MSTLYNILDCVHLTKLLQKLKYNVKKGIDFYLVLVGVPSILILSINNRGMGKGENHLLPLLEKLSLENMQILKIADVNINLLNYDDQHKSSQLWRQKYCNFYWYNVFLFLFTFY